MSDHRHTDRDTFASVSTHKCLSWRGRHCSDRATAGEKGNKHNSSRSAHYKTTKASVSDSQDIRIGDEVSGRRNQLVQPLHFLTHLFRCLPLSDPPLPHLGIDGEERGTAVSDGTVDETNGAASTGKDWRQYVVSPPVSLRHPGMRRENENDQNLNQSGEASGLRVGGGRAEASA